MIMPDYSLIHMVQKLSDGADVHKVAQDLNIYTLAIQALNESNLDAERAELDAIRQRAERSLRIFVTRKTLGQGEKPKLELVPNSPSIVSG